MTNPMTQTTAEPMAGSLSGDGETVTWPGAVAVTDLDSTLVFTGDLDTPGTVCVDKYSSSRGGLIAADAFLRYKQLADVGALVALTTRTVSEYSRMGLPQLRFALVANGTRLLIDGVDDETWHKKSLEMIADVAPPAAVHEQVMATLVDEPVKTACCDEAFVVVAVSRTALDQVDRIVDLLPHVEGYTQHRVGRKTYLLPESIEKHLMLERFWDHYGRPSRVMSAGDSTMDAGFVTVADFGVVPGCAGIADRFGSQNHVTVTESRGVMAGVDVMAGLASNESLSR